MIMEWSNNRTVHLMAAVRSYRSLWRPATLGRKWVVDPTHDSGQNILWYRCWSAPYKNVWSAMSDSLNSLKWVKFYATYTNNIWIIEDSTKIYIKTINETHTYNDIERTTHVICLMSIKQS